MGFIFLLRGFNLIFKPGVRVFVLIPLLINIIFFSVFIWLSWHLFDYVFTLVQQFLPSWLAWLSIVLWVIFTCNIFILAALSFAFVANVIAAPFNSLLSEKVESYLTGTLLPKSSWWQTMRSIPTIMRRELQKFLYYSIRALGLFILLFIPVIQFIVPFLWLVFNAWMMSLQYIDYPADNHHISFLQMRQQMNDNYFITWTFGASALFLSLIPVINLFVMPAAVAGATAMWVDMKSVVE